MAESEVARLLQEIEETYRAAQNGLTGLAQGVSRHEFITSKMERIGLQHASLAHIVGADKAMSLVAERLKDV